MDNYHMYLVTEDSEEVVDDVVVKASRIEKARIAAEEYFAEHGAMDGYKLSAEYGRTSAEADIDATAGNSRSISL